MLPEKIQEDIAKRTMFGEEKLVSERITAHDVNNWAPMRKFDIQMWSSACKKVTVKDGDKLLELKED